MTDTDRVKAYYDQRVRQEWTRLDESWLEYAVTRHFIDAVLAPGSVVLDIGGGPGRYAFALAGAGHQVDLADLSPANIAFAEEHARQTGTRLRSTQVLDARDLSPLADESYDLVLNLGPLYHLLDAADRVRAVRECWRVLKAGGWGFFAFISRYAPVHFTLKTAPSEIEALRSVMTQVRQAGQLTSMADSSFFTDSVFVDPADIAPFMTSCGIDEGFMFGAESLMAQSEARLRALIEPERRAWLEFAIAEAKTPGALYASEHIVFAARKP